jgi:hypothetical protein
MLAQTVCYMWFFFSKHSTYGDAHIHACTLTHMNTHNPTLYEHLQKTKPIYLEIDEITTDASLSTSTSPATTLFIPFHLLWSTYLKILLLIWYHSIHFLHSYACWRQNFARMFMETKRDQQRADVKSWRRLFVR